MTWGLMYIVLADVHSLVYTGVTVLESAGRMCHFCVGTIKIWFEVEFEGPKNKLDAKAGDQVI